MIPDYDPNTVVFPSSTLSRYMFTIGHCLSHTIDVAGECKCNAWVNN